MIHSKENCPIHGLRIVEHVILIMIENLNRHNNMLSYENILSIFSWYLEIFSYENTYLYLLENFHWYKNCSSLHWSCLHTIFAHLDFFFLPTITDNAFWSIFEVFTRKRIIFILILWGHDPINEWNNNSIR